MDVRAGAEKKTILKKRKRNSADHDVNQRALKRRKSGDIQEDEEQVFEDCPICLEKQDSTTTAKLDCCQHTFCFDCIKKWGEKSNECPVCRRRYHRISSHESTTENTDEVTVEVPDRDFHDFEADHPMRYTLFNPASEVHQILYYRLVNQRQRLRRMAATSSITPIDLDLESSDLEEEEGEAAFDDYEIESFAQRTSNRIQNMLGLQRQTLSHSREFIRLRIAQLQSL